MSFPAELRHFSNDFSPLHTSVLGCLASFSCVCNCNRERNKTLTHCMTKRIQYHQRVSPNILVCSIQCTCVTARASLLSSAYTFACLLSLTLTTRFTYARLIIVRFRGSAGHGDCQPHAAHQGSVCPCGLHPRRGHNRTRTDIISDNESNVVSEHVTNASTDVYRCPRCTQYIMYSPCNRQFCYFLAWGCNGRNASTTTCCGS